MEAYIEKITALVTEYGVRVLAAAFTFFIGKWAVHKLTDFTEKLMEKRNVELSLRGFLKNILHFGCMTFVILATLSKLGIQTASFIAVLGAAGLAVGLALQGSLSNFAAGVMIILFKPFKVGDFIVSADCKGTVKDVGIFTTTLATPDNVKVIIPNGQILSSSIPNYSANATRRIDLVFGISYSDNIGVAKEVFQKIVNADERVLKDPAVTIAVSELGDSSVNFVVRPWVLATDYWAVYFDLTEKIKLALEDAGCTIPFPQRDVHVVSDASNKVAV
ncbi:MAG: mechanosensitive ion channel [Candidatus Omnitrophica bacterium]|nr:mechanosensitive ion channel [Candidatus Omnitrophota bacterium]